MSTLRSAVNHISDKIRVSLKMYGSEITKIITTNISSFLNMNASAITHVSILEHIGSDMMMLKCHGTSNTALLLNSNM